MKLFFPGSSVGPDVFADLLDCDVSPPDGLLLIFGGAVSSREEDASAPFLRLIRGELLPRLPTPPERLAVVGYSLGAALAVLLARASGHTFPEYVVSSLLRVALDFAADRLRPA